MNAKLKSKWIVDAGLFAIFLTAFFLNLTGLSLHQWLGVFAGALGLYHLVTNWTWVKKVTARLFKHTPGRPQLYYLIDTLLFGGLFTIVATGLVISSWLNLALAGYTAWRFVHITASILTLVLVVVKIALHWRWIATVARGIFAQPLADTARMAGGQPSSAARLVTRRDFARLMAVVGAGSAFALLRGAQGLQSGETTTATSSATDSTTTDSPSQSSISIDLTSLFSGTQSDTTSSASASACVVRCNRGCSFPGHCRRYTDTNGNNRCDLGECI